MFPWTYACVSIHTLAHAQMAAAQRGLGVVITECEAHYLTRSDAVCRVSVLLLLARAMNWFESGRPGYVVGTESSWCGG